MYIYIYIYCSGIYVSSIEGTVPLHHISQSGRSHQDDEAKNRSKLFMSRAIKSDPRRFLTSYWYHWIGNFDLVLFRGVTGSYEDQTMEKKIAVFPVLVTHV